MRMEVVLTDTVQLRSGDRALDASVGVGACDGEATTLDYSNLQAERMVSQSGMAGERMGRSDNAAAAACCARMSCKRMHT